MCYNQRFLMITYPLKDIVREQWERKISCTSMYTIPAEDEAYPVLQELNQILTRLLQLPLHETLDESLVEYFFTHVFPTVCQKIIRSRYFKNPQVLKVSNFVLQKSVYLVAKFLEFAIKNPKFMEILTTVFSDEYYFKNNNQMTYMMYPYSYFPNNLHDLPLQVGDLIDVLKIGNLYEKVTWSQGRVLQVDEFEVLVAYLYDSTDKKVRLKRDSPQIAPLKSMSRTFQWRMALKKGDLVDVQDSFGTWYNGTVLEIIEKEEGKKSAKVTLKVYDEMGNKSDENGSYFGFSEYEEILDITSPKLAPFTTVAKQFCYQSSKAAAYDSVEDINDFEFPQMHGSKIYALPRKKHLSQFQFQTINEFGERGGFNNYLEYLEKEINFDVLCYFVKGVSGVAPYLHRELVRNLVEKIRVLFEKYLFGNSDKSTKVFTKQQSEMTFSGLKALQKRIYSFDYVTKYENSLKMKLAQNCLQSEAIKNKLLGLNELKDIVRSVTYSNEKNKYIRLWVKNNKIFEKIYIINSHVQLIKKSEQFFKYLINENILEVTDLQRLYKMAQKGDFESRVSLYKLFQEVSHIFKKEHVEFLIDTILESELNLILNEDIDLLHELSRFSNYFPLEKVIKFFENIILCENKVKQLNDYAIKKYSEIVSKNQEVKPYRRNIIKNFLEKLSTHDISQVTKVLKGIFDGIAIGDWGKKDLNEILLEEKVDEVVVEALKKYKSTSEFSKVATVILDFLLCIYKISHKVKINIKTLDEIWTILQGSEQKQKQFYRWANEISKCEQGFQNSNTEELQQFYRKLFSPEAIPELQGSQFELAKNLFVEVNKKLRYITVSSTFKQRELEKEYKRKVEMKSLKLIDIIVQMVYFIKSETINNQVLAFFIELYTSKDNSQAEIDQFLTKLLSDFQHEYESKNFRMLVQTIKLIEVVINDSEKNVETKINSLISKKQSELAKFIIINQVSYLSSDSLKKSDMILPMNTSIMKLRKLLAKHFNLTWQQVKIVSHKEVEDYENSRTLKQVKLNPNQPLTVSRRVTSSQSQEELILNDELNPKAIRCFKVIFEKYSTDGKMDKTQCNSFTTVCLGSNCSLKYYNEKISSLYSRYDEDNDGLLTFENFLRFYEDAAKDRPPTVWSNLRSFGVKGDFRFNNEPEELVEVTKYPRNIISEYPNVYDILFDLLHVKEVASVAFELLERLPVSKSIEEKLINVETSQDLSKILSTADLYQLFYKLNIIEYLAHSTELQTPQQKNWHAKFIQLSGYQLLYDRIENIMRMQVNGSKSSEMENIAWEISETGLNLLNQYWIQCFSADPIKARLALVFIATDEQIDDKMDYLIYGRFFRSQRKLEPRPSKLPKKNGLYIWGGKDKQSIRNLIIPELERKWVGLANLFATKSDSDVEQKRYSITMLINKFLDTLYIICIDQDPRPIANIMPTLFDNFFSSDLTKRLYCFILSQCFFSRQAKCQGVFISELFKNLTKRTITSEHFRVLAVLVSRFGIESTADHADESEEATNKLKEVLFQNVLNNSNELTVEGCAKLLANFNLEGTSYETFEKIWQEKLFNPSTFNQKEQSKVALYELILKICDSNPSLINQIIERVLETLNKEVKYMKIVYCNQFKQRSSTGYAGLKNLGSTCYINSMIQQLYMNRNFRYCILRAEDRQPPNLISTVDNKNEVRTVDDNFLHQLQRIFANLESTNRIDFAPRDFCVAYKPFGEPVNVLIQQDVQQFVSMFFDRLEAGLARTVFSKLVSDFYVGKTVNLFKCHSCQQTKKVEQTFHSISLQVKTSKTLAESFNRFCHGEMITDYKCQFCQQKVDVTKKTRISVAPKMLIIHLQRIVFNLDTFINEKITTKHSFPHSFNLSESTLDYYEKGQTGESITNGMQQLNKAYNYNLIGIICHSGTADSGHYISYIKTADNKWIEFNDSQVTVFNPNNIESECFGGYFASASFDDEYYEEKKESSKSAYLLIYQKEGDNKIQLMLNKKILNCKSKQESQKVAQQLLTRLDLKSIAKTVKSKADQTENNEEIIKNSENQNTDNGTPNIAQSHEESSSAHEDSEAEAKLLEQKQIQIKRHQSEDNIDPNLTPAQVPLQKQDAAETQQDVIISLKNPVSPYIPENLQEQIAKDNEIHFFEKCLSSASFVKFFSMLISKPNALYEKILPICQRLTFGFWLKSSSFKDLLGMLDGILKIYPQGFEDIVTKNASITSLLIQSSDVQIRTAMASFLSKVIADTLEAKNITIKTHNDDPIFKFLDHLLSLLPSTVSRCWTKFGQYFQFWHELSNKGKRLVEYMIDREIIKHFMDYFLDTKSPLKIYATKREHPIGSSYANPNFSMLLKCVFSLLQHRMILNQASGEGKGSLSSNPDEEKLLMSFDSLEKLISDNYENIASQLIKQICPHNLVASEKAAIVIIKGISKSNTQNIQPYLEILHEFVLIDDQYQDLRIKWVIGKQTLAVSNLSLKIIALNSYSLSQRIHNFESSINLESSSSLLEPILTYHNRIQTFALLCTKQVLRLCDVSKKLRKYIFNLESPTLTTVKFVDFFKGFIQKYNEDHKKSYGFYSSSVGFNREEFGKEVKQLYERVLKKVDGDEEEQNEKNLSSEPQAQKNQISETKEQELEKESAKQTQVPEQNKQEGNEKTTLGAYKQKLIQFEQVQQTQEGSSALVEPSDFPSLLQPTSSEQKQESEKQQNKDDTVYSYQEEDDGWQRLDIDSEVITHEVPKRGNREKQTYNIKVMEEKREDSPNKYEDGLNYTDEQNEEPLMKTKEISGKEKEKTKQKERQSFKDYKQAWHPVKFDYILKRTVEVDAKFPNIKIEEHQSVVTYVLTKPTGITNRSFSSISNSHKNYEKMSEEVWKNKKQVKVHGFYVKNNSKDSIRIQTEDGCAYCRSGENLFVWSNEIVRIWESDKCYDWPKWSMFN